MSDQQEDEEIPLTFDEWVDLSARMQTLDDDAKEVLLAERDLDLEAWGRCDRHYSIVMAMDLRAGRKDRVKAYVARLRSNKPETPNAALGPADKVRGSQRNE